MEHKNNFLTYFIIVLTSFGLGYGFCFYSHNEIKNELGKTEIRTDKKIENKNSQRLDDLSFLNLNLRKLKKTYTYIREQYYNGQEIDGKILVDGMVKGMVESLGDPHSEYLDKQENKTFTEFLDGDFEGIGAVIKSIDTGILVEKILKGSGAEEAGLKNGDIIIKANDIDVIGIPIKDAISHIKGPDGSKVNIVFLRDGEEKTLEVTRKKIEIPSVESEYIEDKNIGYIAINTFGTHTGDEFLKALIDLKDTSGIIIDVRNNSGGYLEIASQILSNFIEKGKPIVSTKEAGNKKTSVIRSSNTGNKYKGKIVVLINENSASASEILAGALNDYDKAILVGKKSYGKGSVQIPFPFSDGSMVKLTVAKWFTPNDINIDKVGIDPDIEIDFTEEDYNNIYDRQKEEAIKILEIYIKKGALGLSIDTFLNENPKYRKTTGQVSDENNIEE